MRYHSQLTQESLKFDEIVRPNLEDYNLISSFNITNDFNEIIDINAVKSLVLSNNRNIFHLGRDSSTFFIDILLKNKDHEEEIIVF